MLTGEHRPTTLRAWDSYYMPFAITDPAVAENVGDPAVAADADDATVAADADELSSAADADDTEAEGETYSPAVAAYV